MIVKIFEDAGVWHVWKIDQKTRIVTVRVRCPNIGDALKVMKEIKF